MHEHLIDLALWHMLAQRRADQQYQDGIARRATFPARMTGRVLRIVGHRLTVAGDWLQGDMITAPPHRTPLAER